MKLLQRARMHLHKKIKLLYYGAVPFVLITALVTLAFLMTSMSVMESRAAQTGSRWNRLFKRIGGSKWFKVLAVDNPLENQKANGVDPQNKILILAAPRTGSSFLGALLSAYPNTTFIYEPLHVLSTYPEDIKEPNIGLSLMEDLFNCGREALDFLTNDDLVTKGQPITSETCCSSENLVVKTIRLRLAFAAEEWLKKRQDIKVVHLVRDPRGQLASLSKTDWPNKLPSEQCSLVLSDVRTAAGMDQKRYFRIRYEDLVAPSTQPSVLKSLAAFLALPPELPAPVENFLRVSQAAELQPTDRTHAPVDGKSGWNNRINHFESVYRSTDFFPDANWRRKAREDPSWIAEVERSCGELMNELGYQFHGYDEGS